MQRRSIIIGIAICLVLFWYKSQQNRLNRRRVKYGPMLPRNLDREARLDRLYNGTEANCLSELRMQKSVFHRLCYHLRSRGLLVDSTYVSVEEKVAMFMRVVGHRWTNRSIGFEFMRSGETISRHFHTVLDALCVLSRDLIKIRTTETHPKISTSTGRFHPYFEKCIGALDGTHVPAFVPIEMQDRFRGRKLHPTQNVLAAVDFDLRFIYVLAGWEGSAHDAIVLQDALSRPSGLKIPEGHYFLADAGYATRPGILPPYRGVRYHLKEFQGTRQPENPKELFNLRHSSLRTTVERAFGTLKNRFKILTSQPFFPLKTQVKIVLACCTLHDFILDNGPDIYVYDDETWYQNLPRSNRSRADMLQDNQQWAHMRDELAQKMWDEAQL
ncbi:hypothetical protein U9M48_034523 [Paspalum notatum var. saurae]|uniref:DDE Tnp4 domain-containing protein n=1 Tax=Paspalum notatum var. saurae TaxID=547442 RepID=A0AAQ3UD44_PASNO